MPKKKGKLTFIEEARRKQIIEATIQTIANSGFVNASLAEIADQINVSKGVISYHFNGKDDLIKETFQTIINTQRELRDKKMALANTPMDKIKAYFLANFEFYRMYPVEVRAQIELISSFNSQNAKRDFEANVYTPISELLRSILKEGQENGEFRDFNVNSMASLLIASVEGIMFQWIFNQNNVDLDQCAQEMIGMFEKHIKK